MADFGDALRARLKELEDPGIQETARLRSLGSTIGREQGTTPREATPPRLSQSDIEVKRLGEQRFDPSGSRADQRYPESLTALSDSTKHKELFPDRFPDTGAVPQTELELGEEQRSLWEVGVDDRFRSGTLTMDNATPAEQAYLRKKYSGSIPSVARPKAAVAEPISTATERINKSIVQNLRMIDGGKSRLNIPGLDPAQLERIETARAFASGGATDVELPEIGKEAARRNVTAYEDTLANLGSEAVDRLGIKSYPDYFERKIALEGAIQQYDQIKSTRGEAAADAWLAEAADGATIDALSSTYRMFTPNQGQ